MSKNRNSLCSRRIYIENKSNHKKINSSITGCLCNYLLTDIELLSIIKVGIVYLLKYILFRTCSSDIHIQILEVGTNLFWEQFRNFSRNCHSQPYSRLSSRNWNEPFRNNIFHNHFSRENVMLTPRPAIYLSVDRPPPPATTTTSFPLCFARYQGRGRTRGGNRNVIPTDINNFGSLITCPRDSKAMS